jgi:ATP-binding cassette subfamily B (MDR/TAP) protein 1
MALMSLRRCAIFICWSHPADVLSGVVTIDGVDIRQYNLKWLRAHMGLVSQEPLLFSATILDNIR